LSVHPSASVNVPKIEAILNGWERAGWVPDIIIIDYADLLAPITAREQLHQIDETWAALRGLSQSRHCLVVTATQASAQSFRAETINETHFSGNKLKLAHVTGMVGISATPAERSIGISRLNWIVRREGEFDTDRVCHCAGCLAIANPAIKSIF
jgi:replicative DNA helicase